MRPIAIIPATLGLGATLALAGCGETQGERALSGGAIGAATGAAGSAIAGGSAGTGAVVGGATGAVVGAVTDEEDIDLDD
ncbi:MAG TPA: YMGG-like glycine zipper-containing protein [Paracoccaceae bacterium]|nr:YMGG-like glycine zipper-containing protein [Paracoccaceae bacterium]